MAGTSIGESYLISFEKMTTTIKRPPAEGRTTHIVHGHKKRTQNISRAVNWAARSSCRQEIS